MGRNKIHHQKDHEDAIIEWISEGKTLRDYCRQPDTPHHTVIYGWMEEDEAFSHRFARAREIGADAIAQETLTIVDEHPPTTDNGSTDSGFVAWQKARVETRLKLLAKWSPKKYGDRIDHTSSDGSMTPTFGSLYGAKNPSKPKSEPK